MTLLGSLREISRSEGDGPVDWDAVVRATQQAVDPGNLALSDHERRGYRLDVTQARNEVASATNLSFDLPDRIQIHDRYHWIEANVGTFRRVMRPVEERHNPVLPEVTRAFNTGTMTVTLGFLARNVLGQYDPLLLADDLDHGLYFVHPNIRAVAEELSVDFPRFRRWITFHEVAHAAEFGAAPWLSSHLEAHLEQGIDAMIAGKLDTDTFRELDATMTAVEGYAELIMDRAFDDEYADLREKLDERRRRRGPVGAIVRRLLGLDIKRRQYERGKTFFEHVAAELGIEETARVWDGPESLPSWEEYDDPDRWIARIEP